MKILTINQVADLLQVSRPRVYDLMNKVSNPIPYTRIGKNSVRFIEEDIKSWLDRTCGKCGGEMFPLLENNGFTEPEGQTHYESTGKLQCPNCDTQN